VIIGVITVLARLVGFGRQVVFAHAVGTTCLGTAYTTANMVPNIIYDIVLGGALASVVVPARHRYGDPGALVIYGFAWAVFVVPFAVLAVPIATSTFPEPSATAETRPAAAGGPPGGGFDETAGAGPPRTRGRRAGRGPAGVPRRAGRLRGRGRRSGRRLRTRVPAVEP
jgi:hypothetical protein